MGGGGPSCGRLGHPGSCVMGSSLWLTLALSALLPTQGPCHPHLLCGVSTPRWLNYVSALEVPREAADWVRGSSVTGRGWGGGPPLKHGGSV